MKSRVVSHLNTMRVVPTSSAASPFRATYASSKFSTRTVRPAAGVDCLCRAPANTYPRRSAFSYFATSSTPVLKGLSSAMVFSFLTLPRLMPRGFLTVSQIPEGFIIEFIVRHFSDVEVIVHLLDPPCGFQRIEFAENYAGYYLKPAHSDLVIVTKRPVYALGAML
jgi:hypothetical protein